MAAGNAGGKSLGLQISLIFFVMVAILLGVFAYMFYDDGRQLRAQLLTAQEELSKQKSVALERAGEVEELKAVLGYENLTAIGERGTPDPNSVVTSLVTDLNNSAGPGQAGPRTVKEALAALRQQLDTTNVNFVTAQAEKKKQEDEKLALDDGYRNRETQLETRAKGAEDRLASQVSEHNQEVKALDTKISSLGVEIGTLRTDKAQMAQDHEAQVRVLNKYIE
jgi:hypothetical protein